MQSSTITLRNYIPYIILLVHVPFTMVDERARRIPGCLDGLFVGRWSMWLSELLAPIITMRVVSRPLVRRVPCRLWLVVGEDARAKINDAGSAPDIFP
jgi:hypothetical protein